ncbi:MAG: DNA repair exonuclease [Saprospiraceae bacterium]|nr:DNA repair exonuclease [Saprospiraceae bacterium]MDW8483383.1 DNA repair exonuclease [Saprospiraceae bacterium]
MKILHFSDTHLGFQAFDRVHEDIGVNAREQDIYDAFERVITRALEERPSAVIHSGDFFHRPSPSNRALTFAFEQLRRLSDAGIPLVLIAGNHETPRTFYNSPILRALRTIPNVYAICGQQWETYSFHELAIHGVPHINDERLLRKELERMTPIDGCFNLLLLHTSIGKSFLMDEYGEQAFPAELEERLLAFQFIALGHWHNMQRVSVHPNAWYAGSTERLSDAEIGVEKGFLWIKVHSPSEVAVSFEPLPTRSWLKCEINRCYERSSEEILHQLKDFAQQNDIYEAIVSISLDDLRPEQSIEFTNMRLKEVFPTAFELLVRRRIYAPSGGSTNFERQQFEQLEDIFAGFVRQQLKADPQLAERLIARALPYFRQFEE